MSSHGGRERALWVLFLKNIIFQLQFTFNIILYYFQVYSIALRQLHTLQSVPPMCPVPPSTIHSYYNIIDFIMSLFCNYPNLWATFYSFQGTLQWILILTMWESSRKQFFSVHRAHCNAGFPNSSAIMFLMSGNACQNSRIKAAENA